MISNAARIPKRTFPRSARMLQGKEFKWVFSAPERKVHGRFLTLLLRRQQAESDLSKPGLQKANSSKPGPSKPGSLKAATRVETDDPETHQHRARLGLALAKKKLRLAVQRNRVRRIVREAFRVQRYRLPDVDIVVVARSEAGQATRQELRKDLDRMLRSVR